MRGLDFDSLGFSKPYQQHRIIVAMSGGVDSSVAAALLHEAGFEVIGITLQLYDHGAMVSKKGACCAGQDIYDAAQVAEKRGFPHYVLDYESIFKASVMEDFVDTYLRGETPIPCVRCNQRVKFQDLFKTARDLGGTALATGHYVQRKVGSLGAELYKAFDPQKDQSYFLFATTKEQLEFLRFPLGHLTKEETRYHADRLDLPVAQKPDSQDICFVPNGKYAEVIQKLRPGALDKGNIIDEKGVILGEHDGIIHFTVGQRKGLKLSHNPLKGEPLYVLKINPTTRDIIVGSKKSLGKIKVMVGEFNWLAHPLNIGEEINGTVKIRSVQEAMPATLQKKDAETAYIFLKSPEFGVSPGQACVFYQDSRVLGGGWIKKAT